ncbi:hypothetical protein GCM10011583_72500 [Streptomyces camponoticapitis]|uniref:Uncharacterized protein n=1 Tax=Streptomyces camponoticapitis TaxID=1616125 RepID=A0ABQ2EWP5_9ACTN|nr:hypothetical protein GCM10011583_72500 [Streptomyces camponoticapitis]
MPTLDVCPETGRARLFYRRADEVFEESTRLLANSLSSPGDIEALDGWTLHRPPPQCPDARRRGRHPAPILLAHSRHVSVRSLEWHARSGVGAVARYAAARRRT